MARLRLDKLREAPVRDIIILIVVTLAVTVPFINQAFRWDDRDFVEQAEVLAREPGKLRLEDYSALGRFYPKYPFRHPPLTGYYMSLFIRVGGVSEPLIHTAYLFFPVIAAVSMYSLGRRFTGQQPLAAALLFVLTPGVMVMSHTVMGNLPGVSLWLAATALFIRGVDRYSWKLLLLSGFVMAADILTFAQAIALVPLLVLYALLYRRRLPVFLTFLLPLAVYAFWRYYVQLRLGHPPAVSYVAELNFDLQARDILTFLGGAIIFPVSVWIAFLRRKIDLLAGFIAIPPVVTWAAVYFLSQGDLNLAQGVIVALLAGAGFLIIYGFAAGAASDGWILIKQRKLSADNIFLSAWFAAILSAYVISSLPFIAVRHLLPLFAPVVLLFIREAEKLWPRLPRVRTGFIVATILVTGLFSLAASIADYRAAGLYRETAGRMAQEYGNSQVKVWSLGEFEWRYYMEKNGFEYLGVNSEARPGDLVIVSEVHTQGLVAPLPEGFFTVESRIEPADRFPVRIMNPWAGAGFYGNPHGPVPVIFSREKLDEITVNRLDW
ncbi:MAG: glycosyltransferase family 39 protein [Thermoleophilia bacterium]|nr:glycosyltransferase family 39 protein [Thermoleophilia bacterium]